MKHLHERVILTALVCAALVAIAYALLGIGFAVIVGVGLLVVLAVVLIGVVVFEEERHEPWSDEARIIEQEHGYHPTR